MHFCCSKPKNYVEKAKTKQKVSATYRRVENLSRQMSRAVTADLVNGIVSFKRKIKKRTLLDAYESGDYNGMLEAVPWDDFENHFEHFDRSLKTAAVKSGNITIPTIPAPDNAKIRFDIKNPNLDRYVKRRTGNLIVDIKQQSLDHVRATIERSFNEALTPDRIADEIRSSIGLLPRQEQALRNYKDGLLKQGIDPDKVDAFGDSYAERLLTSRCMTIARTETRRATNYGQLSVWQEGAAQGFFDKEKAKKVWIVDGNPCPLCEPMDGVGVPIDGVWTLADGTICDIPTDSHPNCYCGMEMDFGESEEE